MFTEDSPEARIRFARSMHWNTLHWMFEKGIISEQEFRDGKARVIRADRADKRARS